MRITNSIKSTSIVYRKDIDGLRAIAVLSVIGFHFFPHYFPGGFVGVDIFFIISGYLISRIIIAELEHQKFSFLDFYARRIRRIFPALILVLVVCYVFGWFTLLAEEYALLGKHIAGGAGFISNLILWNESGYFDLASDLKPLLHLWSLGIEEQFYLLIPAILYITHKTKMALVYVIGILAISSFCANIYYSQANIILDFYSPQTRFWELFIGGFLTLFSKEWVPIPTKYIQAFKSFLSYSGIALIGLALSLINHKKIFPGYWALLPTLGAACLIAAGPQAPVNKLLLSRKLLVSIGLISYPLYLWHWVLLSFTRIILGETPPVDILLIILGASIIISWLTYILIEKPIRFGKNRQLITILLIIAMGIVGFMGLNAYQRDGLLFRPYLKKLTGYSMSISRSEKLQECINIDHAYRRIDNWFCQLGDKNSTPTYFAYGDSHVGSLITPLDKLGIDSHTKFLLAGSSGCPPLLGIQSMRGQLDIEKHNCKLLNERIFEYVKSNKIPNVILAGFWTYYTGNLIMPSHFNLIARNESSETININTSKDDFNWAVKNTVNRYRDIGTTIWFLTDNPTQSTSPKDALRKASIGQGFISDSKINTYSISLKEHLNTQAYVNTILRGQEANILELDNIYCGDKNCNIAKNGKLLYFDNDHLSESGSILLYQKLKDAINKDQIRAF